MMGGARRGGFDTDWRGVASRTTVKLLAVTLCALVALWLGAVAAAQDGSADAERAIAIAARHPMFATGLAAYDGWTASAYGSQDRYGLWRVDFFAADGASLGWAQVGLDDERVFAWDSGFGIPDVSYEATQEALLDFLRYDSEFLAFAGDVDDNDWTWVGYDDSRDAWTVYLERGPESLVVTLRSANEWARSLDNLRVVEIEVPALVAVDEWRSMRGSAATALAFTDARIAAAVRGLEGWVSEAEQLGESVWLVRFRWEGRTVAEAEVDLVSASVAVR